MLTDLSVTETQATSNGQTPPIKPAVWGEYEIKPLYLGGRCWTAVWLTSDGPVLGGVRYDRATDLEYVETHLDADGAYVPAPEDWERGIIRELNQPATRGQIASAA